MWTASFILHDFIRVSRFTVLVVSDSLLCLMYFGQRHDLCRPSTGQKMAIYRMCSTWRKWVLFQTVASGPTVHTAMCSVGREWKFQSIDYSVCLRAALQFVWFSLPLYISCPCKTVFLVVFFLSFQCWIPLHQQDRINASFSTSKKIISYLKATKWYW